MRVKGTNSTFNKVKTKTKGIQTLNQNKKYQSKAVFHSEKENCEYKQVVEDEEEEWREVRMMNIKQSHHEWG